MSGPLILSLGLPRTGTASMAEAYTILGYRNVYHALAALDSPSDWAFHSRAADATFPNLASYTGVPFTRSDWDVLYRNCEVITDLPAFYSIQLLAAYPDAKVVLVKRDVDGWFRSIDEGIFSHLETWPVWFSTHVIEPLMGRKGSTAGEKTILGFFEARDITEIRKNAKSRYERHYREVEALVDKERLLLFDIQDGWGPLCEFLGKDVPEVPFPRVNDGKALKERLVRKLKADLWGGAVMVGKYGGIVALAWIASKRVLRL